MAPVSPLVKVFGEEPLQLEAAALVKVVHAGRNAAESDAATRKQPVDGELFSYCDTVKVLFLHVPHSPFKGREAGGQLVELRSLLVLHSIVEEVTDSVHLLVAEVAAGAEVERQGGELHVDAAAATGCKHVNVYR